MSHYLVTGGAGFIGSHLVNSLIVDKHQVTVLDNLSTGKVINVHPDARIIVGDIRDKTLIKNLINAVDGCFHLAAIVSVKESMQHWYETHSINLSATVNIFEAIKECKKNIPIIYASSAAVYGIPEKNPISEMDPCKPLSAYGADKLGCEIHARIAWQLHGIPNMGLRLFNVYGPGQDPNSPYSGVIPILFSEAITKRDLTIFGDGKQTRDFVYVSDVVNCFRKAMDSKQLHGQAVNVCTGKYTSIEMLVHAIKKTTQSTSKIKYFPKVPGDIVHSCGDTKLAKEMLFFTAKNTLEDQLDNLYKYMIESNSIM